METLEMYSPPEAVRHQRPVMMRLWITKSPDGNYEDSDTF